MLDSRRSRVLFVGSLLGTAGVVTFVTLWLTLPRVVSAVRDSSVDRAVQACSGMALGWTSSWRDQYQSRIRQHSLEERRRRVDPKVWESILKYFNSDNSSSWQRIGVGDDVSAPTESRLAAIRPAPEFTLTDQAGEPFRFRKRDGRVRLVSFVFTTCNGTCPATTHRLAQVRQELKSRGLLAGDRVRFASITLDPDRDTPDALERYRKLYDIDSTVWSFLTGPPPKVQEVIAAWGMWARPVANGQLDHPSRVFLVDPQGRVREIYSLSFLKPTWVADDVNLLLDEARRDAAPER